MGTELNQCEGQRPRDNLPRSKNSALIAQHSVFSVALCTLLLALSISAKAQQPKKVPRIGFLTGAPAFSMAARVETFRQGLRELGYVEGKNIVIEYRYAEGNSDRLPRFAAELVRLKIDVIVTAGPASTRSAK